MANKNLAVSIRDAELFSACGFFFIITAGSFGKVKQIRGKKKRGRNDPCFCGRKNENGIPVKYKNCHGKKS